MNAKLCHPERSVTQSKDLGCWYYPGPGNTPKQESRRGGRGRVSHAAPAGYGGTNAEVLRLRSCLAALRMTEKRRQGFLCCRRPQPLQLLPARVQPRGFLLRPGELPFRLLPLRAVVLVEIRRRQQHFHPGDFRLHRTDGRFDAFKFARFPCMKACAPPPVSQPGPTRPVF